MTFRYMATELARRYLTRLYPVGIQIARAQLHVGLMDMHRDKDRGRPNHIRYYLPLQLTDLPNATFGGGWTGIHLTSCGTHNGIETILIDLIVEGPQWGYDDSQIIIENPVPEATKLKIAENANSALGLPDYLVPMNVLTDSEDKTVIRISQERTEFTVRDLGSARQWGPDEKERLPLPPMGRRLLEIGEVLGDRRTVFENAMSAYRDTMQWYRDRGGPWRMEEFIISREWMVTAKGNDDVQEIDVKRSGGSMNPERSPAKQTILEMDEVANQTQEAAGNDL